MSVRIPYGRQAIDETDIEAVAEALRSDYLTTGPRIPEFEQTVSDFCGTKHAMAVCNGTAALHCCTYAMNISPGDEVIVPAMTFAATANAVLYQGGTPVFADVEPDTLLISPGSIESKISSRTKAIIGVDYAGQPCDWDALRNIANRHKLLLIADACHALGAEYKGRKAGSLADLSVFSFHPVKHIATGEGGMVLTDNDHLAERIRLFRNHGIASDFRSREESGAWYYEMVDLGYNYRITDIQCALGTSQMGKLDDFLNRRREIAAMYDAAFADSPIVTLKKHEERNHAYHLYVVKVPERDRVFTEMRESGIGVNVHYVPVHLHPYYQEKHGTGKGLCPEAEAAYDQILSLPMFPTMTDAEVKTVVQELTTSAKG